MSEILSAEEKERLRKEQMRKIAELEKRKAAAAPSVAAPDAAVQAEAERRKRLAAEEYKAKVLEEEMRRRGFVRHEGEWLSREERDARVAHAEEEKARLAGKVERARERKVERDEAAYEALKEAKAPLQRTFRPVFFAGLAACVAGGLLLWFMGVKGVGPAGFLNVAGAGALAVSFYVLFEAERELMRAQRVRHDDEWHDFEYESIRDPLRRMLRSLARSYDPVVRAKFEELP